MDSVVSRPVTPPSAPPGADRCRFTRVGCWLIVAAWLAYAVLLARSMGVYAGGSDSSGYLNHARLLAEGHVHIAPRTLPEWPASERPPGVHSALGFKTADDGQTLVPTYPIGLPLFVVAAARIVGWTQAGNVVLWCHVVLGVIVVYGTGRTFGLSRRGAIIAAVAIGGSPVYLMMGIQAMSDVPALVWTTAAVAAAWRSRASLRWAAGAGIAFAVAVLVRPTDALALPAIAVALGLSWRRWVLFGLGGMPGAVLFCVHSHAAYGRYFTTGYGDSAGLEAQWIGVTLRHYARWLPLVFTPLVVAFLGLPLLARTRWREAAILGAWALPFAGFYAAYSCTHETWWYLRFLLPAAPALVIGGLLVLQSFVTPRLSHRNATLAACGALVLAFATNAMTAQKQTALEAGQGEEIYPLVTQWLRQHVPNHAVIAAMQLSGALYYYTDLTLVRWDGLDAASFARLTAATTRTHRPIYAALWPFESDEQHALDQHMPGGRWEKVGEVRYVTIWRWQPAPPAEPSK